MECLSCHGGIEVMSPEHAFDCLECHLEDNSVQDMPEGHRRVVSNPSDPAYWERSCGNCHQKEIAVIKNSIHFTMAGIRYQTLGLWGSDKEEEQRLLSEVGEAFLAQNCVSCHISKDCREEGFYRSTGCAACHVFYGKEGRYKGGDKTLRSSNKIRPQYHRFQRPIETNTCISCHRKNHVGADYIGLYERDTTMPFDLSGFSQDPYIKYHRLSQDVHFQIGLGCVDCHKKEDVMGDGKIYTFALEESKVRCQDCHPRPVDPVHFMERHKNLHCVACHGQWVFGDYGLSIMGKKLQSGQIEWTTGFRFRRWEWITYGFDQKGFLRPLRPKYQYLITWIDQDGKVLLDNFIPKRKDSGEIGWTFQPYTPHTIQRKVRCEACHQNLFAVGQGIGEELSSDTSLTKANPPIIPKMRLLKKEEVERLLNPSIEWERFRLIYLLQKSHREFH